MPNLFSALPVVILAWVAASTSGLTRSATGAVTPRALASPEITRSSCSDSTLNCMMPASSAAAISAADLPTPANTILPPARRRERAGELAARDDVGAGAEPRQGRDHRLVAMALSA